MQPDPSWLGAVVAGEDIVEGRPARRLYESMGFAAAEDLERGPEGGTRQRFRLVRHA